MSQRLRSSRRAVRRVLLLMAGALSTAQLVSVAPCRAQAVGKPSARAVEKARAELAAAQQRLDETAARALQAQASVATARRKLLGEEAWEARQAASAAEQAESSARSAVMAQSAQLKSGQEKLARAQQAVDRATGDKTVAQQTLDGAPPEQKATAEKELAQKVGAAQATAESLVAAQQAVEKTTFELNAAKQLLLRKKTEHLAAQDVAAAAHARALGGLPPITSDQWDYAKARHLLFRAGFGGTAEEVQKLVEMGPHRAVEQLVEYRRRPLLNLTFNILPWERLLSYEQLLHQDALNHLAEQDERRDATQHAALIDWWVQRMTETPRPLEEKLVLFWHDHFASSYLGRLRDPVEGP